MSLRLSLGGGALCALLSLSCGGDAPSKPSALTEADVVRQYALNLRALMAVMSPTFVPSAAGA